MHVLVTGLVLATVGPGPLFAESAPAGLQAPLGLTVEGQRLMARAPRFTAEFEGATLVSVRSHEGAGVEFCRRDAELFPVELLYVNNDRLRQDKHQQIQVKLLSDLAARIIIRGNDSDRELFVRLDPATGDLCVTPNGRSARRGLLAVRWNFAFAREASLVLPCINGLLVESDRDFPGNDRFPWPFRWNAQLIIAERGGHSLMVHSQDTACRFKALNLARKDRLTTLGFDSEQVGPVWDNRSAGGIEWRMNVYAGDWQQPASRYRAWLESAYQLAEKRALRPPWTTNITFAFQWANADARLLDALAKIHAPEQTLIHLSNWRTSKYDVDYPDYFPSIEARQFMAKANELGFKVMPHFNYFACYNQHPFFPQVRDWQIRSVGRNEPEGWYWPPETHDYTRMAYIHPGSALWRRTLIDAVRDACRELPAPLAFLDQTLCTWNTDNGVVENLTTVEGLQQMQEEFAAVQPDLVLAGEGLNEISFQRQSFAQAHIHDGWGELKPHHLAAAHRICAFLWQGHSRLVGYYHLGPKDKDADLGVEVYRRMGAIPTLICNDPTLITRDQPIVRRLLDLVEGGAALSNPFYAMDTAFQRPGLTSAQQLDLVRELGFAGIAWHEQPPKEAQAAALEAEKRNLKMFAIYCAAQVTPEGRLTYSAELPGLMAALKGHGTVIWLHLGGKGPAFEALTGSEPLIEQLRTLSDVASTNDLRVALYPHVGEWTARFGDATRLARLVGHPRFGVTFNLCHALAVGDEARIPELLEKAGPLLVTATINGADSGVQEPDWARLIQPLDKGTYDVGIVLRKFKEIGFTGPIGFQGYGINGDARSILEPTMVAWRRLTR